MHRGIPPRNAATLPNTPAPTAVAIGPLTQDDTQAVRDAARGQRNGARGSWRSPSATASPTISGLHSGMSTSMRARRPSGGACTGVRSEGLVSSGPSRPRASRRSCSPPARNCATRAPRVRPELLPAFTNCYNRDTVDLTSLIDPSGCFS
jgi:hypothetical protein